MFNTRSGQEQGRKARIAETSQWLNASPLDNCGQPLNRPSQDEESISAEAVEIELETILVALTTGVDRIECAVYSPAMIAAIKAELSPWEQERVVFLAEEFREGINS